MTWKQRRKTLNNYWLRAADKREAEAEAQEKQDLRLKLLRAFINWQRQTAQGRTAK